MTNKEIIQKVNEGFAENNVEKIISYVADDVRWDMQGAFSHVGKDAFRKEINNEGFEGAPVMTIKNEICEGDFVAVEGEVQCKKSDGDVFHAFFTDIYLLKNGQIKEIRSYVVEKK